MKSGNMFLKKLKECYPLNNSINMYFYKLIEENKEVLGIGKMIVE